MKVVELEVKATNPDVPESATIVVEEKKGDIWNRVDAIDVMTGMLEATRRMLLGPNQRLVIQSRVIEDVVFDKDQMAARPKTPDEIREDEVRKLAAEPPPPDESGLPKAPTQLPPKAAVAVSPPQKPSAGGSVSLPNNQRLMPQTGPEQMKSSMEVKAEGKTVESKK